MAGGAEISLKEALAVAVVKTRQKMAAEAVYWKSKATQLTSQAEEMLLLQRKAQQEAVVDEEHTSGLCCKHARPGLSPAWDAMSAECETLRDAGYSAAAVAAVRNARLAECAFGSAGAPVTASERCEPVASCGTPLAAVVSFTLHTTLQLPQGSMQAGLLAAAADFLLHALQPGAHTEAQTEAALHVLVPQLLSAACGGAMALPNAPLDAWQSMDSELGGYADSQASCLGSPADTAPHPAAQLLECLLQVYLCSHLHATQELHAEPQR